MSGLLYKVCAPRDDVLFEPGRFWRTADWASSTTRPRAGYIEDSVLYAGDFDEVSIHLFPRVRVVRVRACDVEPARLWGLNLGCAPGRTAWMFVEQRHRHAVEEFRPTVFTFERHGFERVRRGEYVAREPRRAHSSRTLSMADALAAWNVEAGRPKRSANFVACLDDVIARLTGAGVCFEEQT